MLFDLEPPDEPNGFELAIDVAHLIHELLEEVGLPGYVKTSGAYGIHVVARGNQVLADALTPTLLEIIKKMTAG